MAEPLAIIVTGSRDWTDRDTLNAALEAANPHVVIHGAAKGADTMADEWAFAWSAGDLVSLLPMPAQWSRHGNSAGPRRNREMLAVLTSLAACGYRIEVHTFALPESKGTRHMARLARDVEVPVIDHGAPTDAGTEGDK